MNPQKPEVYSNFLLQVLQLISESGDNPQRVYALLSANLDKLDEYFVILLPEWWQLAISSLGDRQAPGLALGITIFSGLIQKFPLGSFANNLEIAITGYSVAVTVFTPEEKPTVWAVIQNNLGLAYVQRIRGDTSLNIEQAIQCYQAAMQVRTRSAFPADWAQTQMNLGNAYLQRICGERGENVEQAIQCYEAAKQVYTREAFPKEWADTQNNLGAAYKDRIKGARSANLEQAIACYYAALQVRTFDALPEDWAATQNNLGIAYLNRIVGSRGENLEQAIAAIGASLQVRTQHTEKWANNQINLGAAYYERIKGDRSENLEQAIACYSAALPVLTESAFPQKWAVIQNDLGAAYSNRIRGDRSQNLEQAIRCYEASLQVYTQQAFPEQWANTLQNLGAAYWQRIEGELAENLELAIQYYQVALRVRTREKLPQDWAMTQHNLGVAYFNRIKGDRAENIEQAIQRHQAAMLVRTFEAMPVDWADTQLNLGNAYSERIRGDKAENLEQAICCYEAALDVNTREAFPRRWAEIQTNLGSVYVSRTHGNQNENVEQAIECCQAALEVLTCEALPNLWANTQISLGKAYALQVDGRSDENLKAAIACYQAALKVYAREAFPNNWASVMNNLGHAYSKLGQITEALGYFRSALEIHAPVSYPVECLRAGKNLGDTAFAAGRWRDAREGYAVAINAVEISRSWASTEARRQEVLEAEFLVYANMVQACVNDGQLDKAVEYVERSRSQRLVDLMASNELYSGGEILPEIQEYLQQYESLQQQIDSERPSKKSSSKRELVEVGSNTRERAALAAASEDIYILEEKKQQVWEQLRRCDPVLAGQIQVSPLKLAAIQRLVGDRTTAILSFYTTREDTHIFVVRQNQITCHSCLGQGAETFQEWIIEKWLQPYLTNTKEWESSITPVLAELASLLQIDKLIDEHLSGSEELIVMPYLFLHHIPFAALPIEDGEYYLGDKFLIRYAPSCQILEFVQQRPPVPGELIYGIVEDTRENLPFTNFECSQIARLYNIPDRLHLKGRTQATVSNYRQLAKQVQVLHSSHHAQSRLDNPLESKLELGDGYLTLGQLLTQSWRLPQLVDVFLSCCETHLGLMPITDDVLTLSSGFLCAGARSVVNTLWSVSDLATAVFSVFYYQNRRRGCCRSAALQLAQEELRCLSGETLATVYQPQIMMVLEDKIKQFDTASKQAKAFRDKEVKDSPAYLKWDEEYKQHYKAVDRIRKTIPTVKKAIAGACQQPFPFSSPYYWGAFTCSGVR